VSAADRATSQREYTAPHVSGPFVLVAVCTVCGGGSSNMRGETMGGCIHEEEEEEEEVGGTNRSRMDARANVHLEFVCHEENQCGAVEAPKLGPAASTDKKKIEQNKNDA